MKKLIILFILGSGLLVSCYDDSALIERIDALEQSTIASLEVSISSLEMQSTEIKTYIVSLEQSGNINVKEISSLKTSLAAIETKIAELKTWVETLLEGYYSKDEIDVQITSINTELETLRTSISSIESKLAILMREFVIIFDDTEIGILAGGTTSVGYTIIGATQKTTVKVLGQNGWSAKVIPEGTDKGKITVTAPDPLTKDEIIVLVYDGEYRTIMSSINFVTGVVASSQTAYELGFESGTIDVPISTNMNYTISIPDSAKEWLSVVKTKSIRNEVITFSYTANTGYMRNCSVDFIDEVGTIVTSVAFVQKKAIVQTDAIDLSSQGTANCYVISEEGWYKFNIGVKGNSAESVGDVAKIAVVWESFGTEVTPKVGDLIKEVKMVDGYAYIRTPNILKEGNALVAVKDIENNILWSWHIWLTDEPAEQVYYNDAGIMMDRNLGATSTTPGDVGALGLLYQWGRKDPFLGPSSISSWSMAKSTISWQSVESVSHNGEYAVINGTIEFATANPTTFIDNNMINYDWYYTGDNSHDDTLWSGLNKTKSVYDPCPYGWRVPDGGADGVWAKALGSPSSFTDIFLYNNTNNGINFCGKFGDDTIIWYPSVKRVSSNLYSSDSATYWGRSSNHCGLDFSYSGSIYPIGGALGASGCLVRCLQE